MTENLLLFIVRLNHRRDLTLRRDEDVKSSACLAAVVFKLPVLKTDVLENRTSAGFDPLLLLSYPTDFNLSKASLGVSESLAF